MPFWIYGRDAKHGSACDPLFIETADEVEARRQAEETGIIVDEVEFVRTPNGDVFGDGAAFEGQVGDEVQFVRTPDGNVPLPGGARGNVNVILTTTSTIEGRRLLRYLGIVSGIAIVSPSAVTAMTDLTTIVGGRSTVYERELRRARNMALDDIESAALAIEANGIVGLQFQYEMIHSSLMVCVSGTAVLIEESETMPKDSANKHAIRR